MNLTLLLMPLIGGYVFLSCWNFTKFEASFYSGYRLFFTSALMGMILLILAKLILTVIVELMLVDYVRKFIVPTEFSLESTLSMVLGIVFPPFLNCIWHAETHSIRTAKNRGNQLFLTVAESILDFELIELSIANGKVYIGLPVGMRLEDEYVKIDPHFSGYRDAETNVLTITSWYKTNDYGVSQDGKLYVSIKAEEIISVRIFYPEVFFNLDGTDDAG